MLSTTGVFIKINAEVYKKLSQHLYEQINILNKSIAESTMALTVGETELSSEDVLGNITKFSTGLTRISTMLRDLERSNKQQSSEAPKMVNEYNIELSHDATDMLRKHYSELVGIRSREIAEKTNTLQTNIQLGGTASGTHQITMDLVDLGKQIAEYSDIIGRIEEGIQNRGRIGNGEPIGKK